MFIYHIIIFPVPGCKHDATDKLGRYISVANLIKLRALNVSP